MKKIIVTGDIPVGKLANYLIAIKTCGAVPIHIEKGGNIDQLEKASGVVIPGGTDMAPSWYGEDINGSKDINKELDDFEMKVLKRSESLGRPVLGVCRGMQLMNVFCGGSMIQHIDNYKVHEAEAGIDRIHGSSVIKDSFLYKIYGREDLNITSAHHQAVNRVGDGLKVIQHSEDGIIEAIEHESLPWYGLQWHPERMCLGNYRYNTADGLKVFMYYINAICS